MKRPVLGLVAVFAGVLLIAATEGPGWSAIVGGLCLGVGLVLWADR